MVNSIDVHCLGESHKDSGKPCQDYAFSRVEDGLAIAVVCDGHGGDRYFRSDVGSKTATEVIVEVVKDFVQHTDAKYFKGVTYVAEGIVTSNDKKLTQLDVKFRQMFSSIITQWNERIDKHAHEFPLTEWELEHVPQKYLDEFRKNLEVTPAESTLNKQYGCTLMAYVQTSDYWFAFHLGDGKCISFHKDVNFHGQQQVWDEPIPWDDRCFLNKTTSICDSDAINEFRYCYGSSGSTPVAVFLGSDGIDDTYGEMENIANFYVEILKIIAKDGRNAALQQLKDDLPIISRIGSKDDASVAVVFNTPGVTTHIGSYIKFQIDYMDAQAREQVERIKKFTEKKATLDKSIHRWDADRRKATIERDYAVKDLVKASDRLEILSGKIGFLAKEHQAMSSSELPPLTDYSEVIERAKEAAEIEDLDEKTKVAGKPAADSQPEPKEEQKPQPDPQQEQNTEHDSEPDQDSTPEPDTETGVVSIQEAESESASEPAHGPEPTSIPENDVEAEDTPAQECDSEPQNTSALECDSTPEIESESETKTESVLQPDDDEIPPVLV